MGKAQVSVCFIVRDDAATGLLEECFASVRPHVEEIVVVDTGSTDGGATEEICRRYADVFEAFTDCNDDETGAIADFSLARNRAFDLARQRWVMWMDSDDVLRGGHNLEKLIEVGDANRGEGDWCYLFPYEYVYDANGRVICLHYRERLLSRRAAMRWVNPVHEVMIPTARSSLTLVPCDDVVFEHHRQRSKKPHVGGRNLRILQRFVEDKQGGENDPRQFYYLGLEYANAGRLDKAEEWLSRYVNVSGWDDEKTMAALKLAEICYGRERAREGIVWAFRAVETRENWGEGYFALARGFYELAIGGSKNGDIRRNWEKCAHFARMGLALPTTKTMLFVNPQERLLDVHVYLTMALSQLGDARGALEHAERAFKVTPGDPNLVYNRRVFQRLVAKQEAKLALDKLVDAEGIGAESRDEILRALDGGDFAGWPAYARPDTYPSGVEESHFPIARITPHARAFGLPEACDLDDLPVRMTDAQVEAATILLWKELVLHDELIAAERFLADAPYRAKHTPMVVEALARTRRMTAWMDDPAWEQRVNTPADPTIENGYRLPDPLNGALADRSDLAVAPLSKAETVLDLGCFDGGIVNRWALAGYDVTGVDLCEGSIALARKKAKEFETGARFVCAKFTDLPSHPVLRPRSYDVVTTCDTYEHVRDPVGDMIAPARAMLKDGGRMIVVTPHGAWIRGEFRAWAHPWRWGPDLGKPWNCDEPHAHLVAPTPWTVAENFRRDGWWVKDSYAVDGKSRADGIEGQGNVFCEARLTGPRGPVDGALDIVFACGDAWEAWTPLVHRERGIGGSETMVVELAKRLSLMGHRVRVYTSTGKYGEGIFDGVEYRQSAHLDRGGECDVFVAWRNAALLRLPWRARLRLAWAHDVFLGNANHASLLMADRVLALSRWHKGFMSSHHNLPEGQIGVTRNGIDLARFEQEVDRDPHKAVYSSSPDRGLPALLKVWPQIRERVPDATLHVFYGFDNWEKAAQARGSAPELQGIALLREQMKALETHGVVYRDKVDQGTLAREFLSAGVWSYPTWFTETSCITAMEAQAAGLRIVTSSIAALNETVGQDYGVLLDGDWLSADYQERFVDEVVRAMTTPEGSWKKTREELRARAARDFGLDSLADDWVREVRALIVTLRDAPLVSYKQRADFVREAA
jgi:2-polyprenyl-3-methyl-5-hydroxy-6-metoxy-1,4-benzoquinol methylase/glycosyltransferase involved in cell wall biosynthesis